jgi:hypothetical protein
VRRSDACVAGSFFRCSIAGICRIQEQPWGCPVSARTTPGHQRKAEGEVAAPCPRREPILPRREPFLEAQIGIETKRREGRPRGVFRIRIYSGAYLEPKTSAMNAKAAIVAANTRLAEVGLASVEMTPTPITGRAFPEKTQAR